MKTNAKYIKLIKKQNDAEIVIEQCDTQMKTMRDNAKNLTAEEIATIRKSCDKSRSKAVNALVAAEQSLENI